MQNVDKHMNRKSGHGLIQINALIVVGPIGIHQGNLTVIGSHRSNISFQNNNFSFLCKKIENISGAGGEIRTREFLHEASCAIVSVEHGLSRPAPYQAFPPFIKIN